MQALFAEKNIVIRGSSQEEQAFNAATFTEELGRVDEKRVIHGGILV